MGKNFFGKDGCEMDPRTFFGGKPPQNRGVFEPLSVARAAIRERCLDCAETRSIIRKCPKGPRSKAPCHLWPFRRGPSKKEGKGASTLKSIKAYCSWCMCGHGRIIVECPTESCALHPYRMGTRPRLKDKECIA